MRGLRRLASVALIALMAAQGPALAQGAASLIADQVAIQSNRTLVAQGNVEVMHGGARLRASSVTYDRTNGALAIAGPITLTDDAGTVVLASAAELSDDLREGILHSARIVMDRQLQIAAAEMQRLGGRHTVLSKAVASSCQVCADNPTPLWEIRARRVIHDQQERQIYFDNAQVRIAGVPVFWLPHLRMPDPTLERTSGFLMPSLVSSSRMGLGVKVPYFFTLGRSRDLTLTPMLTTREAQSLEFRYRQAFRHGEVELTGAASRDTILAGRRGWLGTTGRFDLPRGYELRFAGEVVSDPGYFRDYGLSDKDRLSSHMEIRRTRRGEDVMLRLGHTHSIRAGEINAHLPQLTLDSGWTRRFALPGIGGTATLGVETHSHRRSSRLDMVGRDIARASVSGFWRRDWLGPAGLLATVEAGATVDIHTIAQDSRWPGSVKTVTPAALVELRWPWARVDGRGNADVIEPVIQMVWSRGAPASMIAGAPGHVPNEDSVLVEFDEGNLFGFNRFAGADRREAGRRINAGLHWMRHTVSGWQIAASAGRVFRLSGAGQFSAASGLAGRSSDWVGALHMVTPGGMLFQGRAVFDDNMSFARGEMRLGLERDGFGLATSWLWAEADPLENRLTDTSEWVIDGRVRLGRNWNARASSRYDFGVGHATAAGLGLEFANECLRVDIAVLRRFTGAGTVQPSTDFGLSVDFLGFGSARAGARPAAACRY